MIHRLEISRITLGAVQLGLPYGAVPTSTMPDEEETQELLSAAWKAGITTIDTARTYGLSEARIGRWLTKKSQPLAIATKFPELPVDAVSGPQALRTYFLQSKLALGGAPIQFYLAHHAPDVMRPEILDTLRALQSEGQIASFGASVYTVSEAQDALSVPDLKVLQIPISLADQRFVDAGVIAVAAAQGVVIFARSVFLQGVLLREPATLPAFFGPALSCLGRFSQCCLDLGISKLSAAVFAVNTIPSVASLVIGINRSSQLEELKSALLVANGMDRTTIETLKETMAAFPADLLDPRDW